MTKLTEQEYLDKICREDRFTLKLKLVETSSTKKRIKICILNMEELIKWRLKYGISQKDMVTMGILGMNLRNLQRLEEDENTFIGHSIMRKIRMNNLINVEFVEE